MVNSETIMLQGIYRGFLEDQIKKFKQAGLTKFQQLPDPEEEDIPKYLKGIGARHKLLSLD